MLPDVQMQNLKVWSLAHGCRATIRGYRPFAALRSRCALAFWRCLGLAVAVSQATSAYGPLLMSIKFFCSVLSLANGLQAIAGEA